MVDSAETMLSKKTNWEKPKREQKELWKSLLRKLQAKNVIAHIVEKKVIVLTQGFYVKIAEKHLVILFLRSYK
jgi:hypothetical protein